MRTAVLLLSLAVLAVVPGCSDEGEEPPGGTSTATSSQASTTTGTTGSTTSSGEGGAGGDGGSPAAGGGGGDGGSGGAGGGAGGDGGASQGGGGGAGGEGGGVAFGEQVPDFALDDVNPASERYAEAVSPRDYLEMVSGWYFGHST